jgi:hypothetical protein
MAVATRALDTPVGVIDKGTVAAQRFTWEGTVGGETVMTVRVNWLMGDDALDPAWKLGEQRFEVALDAEPPVSCTFHGLHPPVIGEEPEIGLTGPAMHCVNAIPYVVAADPGIKTYLDLPHPETVCAEHPCYSDLFCTNGGESGVKGMVNAGDSTPPSTSITLPVMNDDAGDAR